MELTAARIKLFLEEMRFFGGQSIDAGWGKAGVFHQRNLGQEKSQCQLFWNLLNLISFIFMHMSLFGSCLFAFVTFILLTCLLIFLESFPKQGGVIGTRDFGFAGADL